MKYAVNERAKVLVLVCHPQANSRDGCLTASSVAIQMLSLGYQRHKWPKLKLILCYRYKDCGTLSNTPLLVTGVGCDGWSADLWPSVGITYNLQLGGHQCPGPGTILLLVNIPTTQISSSNYHPCHSHVVLCHLLHRHWSL